jgi:hypothetical protein
MLYRLFGSIRTAIKTAYPDAKWVEEKVPYGCMLPTHFYSLSLRRHSTHTMEVNHSWLENAFGNTLNL